MGNHIFQNSNIDMLLLKVLEQEDMYGYELIQKIRDLSGSRFELKTGTIYPILHSLEKNGYVASYEKSTDTGLTRKYYSLTEQGKECLAQKIESWKEYSAVINCVLNG